ncbi:MAG: hypothetical protein Q8O89_00020 [Nanoarchaeota archaeon]|nr:hypothetical protein [Nanoarchaeota archaeon]
MRYGEHTASYNLGDRLLTRDERVIVGTRPGSREPIRFTEHMKRDRDHPKAIIRHGVFSDGEYLPTFLTKNCLEDDQYDRFLENYQKEGKNIFGQGLKGQTVYIVNTFSKYLTPQDLDTRICFIADTAKYNGAEAVVLVDLTLFHSAQERGIWDLDHPRMHEEKSRKMYDGQAPVLETVMRMYLVSGVDAIIAPHTHSPPDTEKIVARLNDEFSPLAKNASENQLTRRYSLKFFNINLAKMIGYYISDHSEAYLGFDLSDKGKNVAFIAPDRGIYPFIEEVRLHSGLTNSALAGMNKKKSENGRMIELTLEQSINLSEERGLEGMYLFIGDDSIRTGRTMAINIDVIRGIRHEGIVMDSKIKGKPKKIVVYATRTNFGGDSVDILSTPSIDDIVITNADPRGWYGTRELDIKTQMLWMNFMMADAAKAIEAGQDPYEVLTADHIREKDLLRIQTDHGHKDRVGKTKTGKKY